MARSNSAVTPQTLALQALLAAKPGAVGAPLPSAQGVVLYKVMDKMFAILSLKGGGNVILKADPHLAEAMRDRYSGVGHRSHLDRRFWIAVNLDADVPSDEVARLVDYSYDQVCARLTRKQKAELAALGQPPPRPDDRAPDTLSPSLPPERQAPAWRG